MQDKSLYDMNTAGIDSVLSTNKVLKNTYMLLGMTLAFSAVCATISMAMGLGHGAALVLSLVGFGLLFVVHKMADSSKGLLAIFAFTGVMGASIGPMLIITCPCQAAQHWLCRHWVEQPWCSSVFLPMP